MSDIPDDDLDETEQISSTQPMPSPDATRRRAIPDDAPPIVNARPPQRRPGGARKRQENRPYYPPQPQRDKASSGLYLPWWSLVLMLVFVGCAAIGALAVVTSLEGNVAPGGSTPLIIVITSTFTVGPPASPTPIPQRPTLTPSPPLPTIPSTLTLPPGDFAIGNTIQVVGVGPSGLNVRSAPGTDSTVKFLAQDGENYVLTDGPQQASGDEWWQIQAVSDSTRTGWASRRFLTVLSAAPTVQTTP